MLTTCLHLKNTIKLNLQPILNNELFWTYTKLKLGMLGIAKNLVKILI